MKEMRAVIVVILALVFGYISSNGQDTSGHKIPIRGNDGSIIGYTDMQVYQKSEEKKKEEVQPADKIEKEEEEVEVVEKQKPKGKYESLRIPITREEFDKIDKTGYEKVGQFYVLMGKDKNNNEIILQYYNFHLCGRRLIYSHAGWKLASESERKKNFGRLTHIRNLYRLIDEEYRRSRFEDYEKTDEYKKRMVEFFKLKKKYNPPACDLLGWCFDPETDEFIVWIWYPKKQEYVGTAWGKASVMAARGQLTVNTFNPFLGFEYNPSPDNYNGNIKDLGGWQYIKYNPYWARAHKNIIEAHIKTGVSLSEACKGVTDDQREHFNKITRDCFVNYNPDTMINSRLSDCITFLESYYPFYWIKKPWVDVKFANSKILEEVEFLDTDTGPEMVRKGHVLPTDLSGGMISGAIRFYYPTLETTKCTALETTIHGFGSGCFGFYLADEGITAWGSKSIVDKWDGFWYFREHFTDMKVKKMQLVEHQVEVPKLGMVTRKAVHIYFTTHPVLWVAYKFSKDHVAILVFDLYGDNKGRLRALMDVSYADHGTKPVTDHDEHNRVYDASWILDTWPMEKPGIVSTPQLVPQIITAP